MTYTPHVWSRHDKLDSAALNGLEQAVGAFSGTADQANAAAASANTAASNAAASATAATNAANLVDAPAGTAIDAHLGGDSTGVISNVTAGSAMHKAETGAARNAALTGHSLMYGFDPTSGGTNPPVNGATGMPRSAWPPPERFALQCGYLSPGPVTAVNQAYPGDRSTEAITRWAGGTSGDIEFFWIDTNDGLSSGAGPALTDAQTSANLRTLINRARSRGSDVVVIGGAPGEIPTHAREIDAAAQANRALAERAGARYVDAGELLRALPRNLVMFCSGVHFNKEGYNLVGTRLAALMGPKGTNPPKVGPGSLITPRDQLAVGGVITSRSGAADSTVWSLTSSQTLGISFDVTAPCQALIRCRLDQDNTTGYGVLTQYYGTGGSGRGNRSTKLTASSVGSAAGGYVWVRGHHYTSPGPDSVVIMANSGIIEIDAVEFIPLTERTIRATGDASFEGHRTRQLSLTPIGGVSAGRPSPNWDTMLDTTSGVSLTNNSAGTTYQDILWRFDLTMGPNNSGALLSQSAIVAPEGGSAWVTAQGYLIIRNGTSLIVRKLDGAGATDVTVTSVFASATGNVRAAIEVWFDSANNALKVYVEGVLQATIASPVWSHYMAGLIAGTAAGGGYAAGTGSVTQKSVALP